MIQGRYAIDCQVHSYRSHDGRASIQEQCEKAIELGLDVLGFTEHKDFDPADPVVNHFDYARYMDEIRQARHEYGKRLKILAGVEIDYQKWFEDKIFDYLEQHSFDFVMGCVHYVDREMLMTPEYNQGRTKRQAYTDYFRAVKDSVESGFFHIIGHLEYANRRGIAAWGTYEANEYREELTAIFEAMIPRGVALEVNTAGLHQNIGLTYPTRDTVALYASVGGALLSVGSDAHHPDQLGYSYDTALQIATDNNLSHLSIWEQGVRTELPILPASVRV